MLGQSVVIRSTFLLTLLLASIAESQPIAYQLCYPVSPLRHPSADPCPDLPTGLISCPVDLKQPNPIPPEYDEYYNAQCYHEWNGAHNGYHTGDDWNGIQGASNDLGAPIFAIGDGELVYMDDRGDGEEHEWGKVIVLRHEYFTGDIFYSLYAHLGEFLLPPLGGYDVKMGEQIATLGDGNGFYSIPSNCSNPDGCAHLHFEIRKEFGAIPAIIPGPGYVTSKTSSFAMENYHSPSEFIEARRASQCQALYQSSSGYVASGVCPPPPGQAPGVTTLSPSNITSASAEFRLSVNPGGIDTDAWFEWDNDQNLSIETMRFYVGSGSSSTTYSYTQDSLSCDTDYFFRAHAENSEGEDQGSTLSFRTGDCSSGGGGGGSEDLILNGDFANDENYWTLSGDFQADDRFDNHRSSPGYAYLALSDGSPGNDLSGRLYQAVPIPANAESATLEYWYSISTQESTGGSEYDRLSVIIEDTSATILDVVAAYSDNHDTSGAYFYDSFDLSHRAGEDIEVHFLGSTDESYPTVFRIDDVSLEVTYPDGEAPIVSTRSADQVTDSSARLNLEVNPGELDTEVWFEWDDDTNLSDATARVSIGSGTSDQDVSITLHSLDCDTTYYFAAFAENDAGDDEGSQKFFHTNDCPGGEPSADTDPATDITTNSAVLTADILPNGRSTDAWFEWGTSSSLGSFTSRQGVGSGTSWRDFEHALSGLDCETTYYFEAHAENSAGEDDGATHSFTTASCPGKPPEAETLPATNINSTSANLRAFITYYGLPTSGWFEWGAGALDKESPHVAFPEEFSSSSLDFGPTSLSCSTTYQYRVVAENEHGRDYGNVLTFGTTSCPSGCGVDDLILSDLTVSGPSSHTACNSISVGPNTWVEAGGDLDLTAPRVIFRNGFSVATGGTLRVSTGQTASPLFQDDFDDNQIDTSKWTTYRERVLEEDGELHVEAHSTDYTGYADTAPIFVDRTRKLVVERRVKVHYSNSYSTPSIQFKWDGFPEHRFIVTYANYSYQGGSSCPHFGFHISTHGEGHRSCAEVGAGVSETTSAIWDEWFDERVVYDPQTGEIDYYINGEHRINVNAGVLPAGGETLTLRLTSSGWWTGHYQHTDDFVVSQ